MYFNRLAESNRIETYYDRTDNGVVILYGHKDTDIQSVIRTFTEGKDHFYYLARNVSREKQLEIFKGESRGDISWSEDDEESFDGIFSRLLSFKCKKRVIVIDEFQNIVRSDPDFMKSVIDAVGDRWANQPVLFVLSSSNPYWIENCMIEKLGELAYEISGLIKLSEGSFMDIVKGFKGYGLKECIDLYSILGGKFLYLKCFDPQITVEENIKKNLLDQASFLYNEGLNILPGELREHSVYNTILHTIALGNEKLNDIHKITGFSRAKISVYIKNLIDYELVEKIDSFENAGKENAVKGMYRISDRFVSFWYRFIFSNMTKLSMLSADEFYDDFIRPGLKSHTADSFRTVCLEYISLLNKRNKLPYKLDKIGRWVGKVGTIDIIGQDSEGSCLIGCCSWEKPDMSYEDFEWLSFCVSQAKLKATDYYLFSGGGFDEALKDYAARNDNIYLIDSSML